MRPLTLAVVVSLLSTCALLQAQPRPPAPGSDPLHRPLDEILDVNVRDGLVYYRALQSQRGRLDRYAASLDVPAASLASWSREQKMAFWVNAYNTFVLQTVINRYPIRGRSPDYPASSIRQIPGAFEKTPHLAAGRNVTLDEIEKTVLPEFKEPRLHLALGRGAVGSGRLRSEAYTAARLKEQLESVQAEFIRDEQMIAIDRTAGTMAVTPIVSWNADHFIAAYDPGATGPMAQRSPIERALIAFITPHLFPLEREFVQQNQFRVIYRPFDWRLNDLTGGPPK
jgi:Protein of unknown function, DUF547